MNLKPFFTSKRIIYTSKHKPAEMVKIFRHNGKKYVRLAFTNLVKFKGSIPMTDIPFCMVTGIRKLPSPFKKWICRFIGKKAKATFYTFKKTTELQSVNQAKK